MKIPEPTDTIINRIDQYHQAHQEGPREHFGLSQVGHHCDRWLWLSWRMAIIEKFPGRILRLFRRGHHEEYAVVEDLKNAGLKLSYTLDNQKAVSASVFVKGHLDGIIESGVPESPKALHVLEIKTHNKKSFDELVKLGVEKAKPLHFAQMQVYMRLSSPIDRALYVAICKDDDRIYTERVRLDRALADKYIARAKRISEQERTPDPCSTDPSFYKCKMCAAHDFCHGQRLTKEINCRTCAHSTPDPENGWTCARWNNEVIPFDAQLTGCDSHVFHPDVVPWEMLPGEEFTGKYMIDGQEVKNGEGGYKSREILVMVDGNKKFNDKTVDTVREVFRGEVVPEETSVGLF